VKKLFRVFVTVLIFAVVILGGLYLIQDSMVFLHVRDERSRAFLDPIERFTEVQFVGSNGKTYHGMLHQPRNEILPLIIYFGGNGEVSHTHMRMRETLGHWELFNGFHYLFVDYDGYGLNEGRAHYQNMYEGALEIFDYAKNLPFVDDTRIVVMGFSIGTGSAVYMAAHRPVAATILLTPFANGYDLYNNLLPIFHGPMRLLVRQKLPSDLHAPNITSPTLIIASRADEIIPFASSQRLADLVGGETTFIGIDGVSHNGMFVDATVLEEIPLFLYDIR